MKLAKIKFESEKALCAAFLASLAEPRRYRHDIWVAYPETCSWDILLVRNDGFQIGIQAKMALNSAVIAQALEPHRHQVAGPDCRAVLVPEGGGPIFGTVCDYIGLTILRVFPDNFEKTGYRFEPPLPEANQEWHHRYWYEWSPIQRHKLPEYVPDVEAGSSAPVQLTHWKISAIRICIILERRGYLTRDDFKTLGIDHRRWLTSGADWLRNDKGRWTKGDYLPNFRLAHPRNYVEIEADLPRWIGKISLDPKPPALGELV